jgi:hypothetical protein
MRKYLLLVSGFLALHISANSFAGDLGVNVILSGQVSPGVYGQVEIGNAPRPVVVYEQPRVVVVDKRYAHREPVYLHVPPGHAKHWRKHCREYHACERQVYFVKSREYEPSYQREHRHDHDHRGRDKGHKHKEHRGHKEHRDHKH